MKKFNDDIKRKACGRPSVILWVVFVLSCFSCAVYGQTANPQNKIDKSKIGIHGNMRDFQAQHIDNSRTAIVQYSGSQHKNVKTRSKQLLHLKTQQGALTKADKAKINKEIKAEKKLQRGKPKKHKKIVKSKRVH